MKNIFSNFGLDFQKIDEALRTNWKLFLATVISMIVVLGIVCFAVFFLVVKSPEEVMVPSVKGKTLSEALLAMQIKELYPKITLRYSENPNEKGFVLEQSPNAGDIVKAGRRINLVVSKGAVLDKVENYVGESIDDVRVHLQTLFAASSKPMIRLPDTLSYKNDEAAPGIILEQNPPADSKLSQPVVLDLIVSAGPGNELATIPYLVDMSLADVHARMARTKLVFNFSAAPLDDDHDAGTVISQSWPDGKTELPIYASVPVILAIPEASIEGTVFGIFEYVLPPYPYALDVKLNAKTANNEEYTVVSFKHPGGRISIPYAVSSETELTLYVLDKKIKTILVH